MVRYARLGSFSSFCNAACTAVSIGTLVNSDSTSKDTMISSSSIVSLLTVDTVLVVCLVDSSLISFLLKLLQRELTPI